jgi:arylformamidase
MEWQLSASRLSRRAMLGATAALAAGPALAEECHLGPAPHDKGARVFMDMDQQELDASYDQLAYEPFLPQIVKRLASNSDAMRARIGAPERESYGPSAAEGLDIYRTKRKNAPIFVFIHGGAWRSGTAKDYGYPAEMFVNAGAHYVAVDFIAIKEAGGDLGVMAKQVRSAVAWCTGMQRSSVATRRGSMSAAIHQAGIFAVWCWSPIGRRNSDSRRTSSKAASA